MTEREDDVANTVLSIIDQIASSDNDGAVILSLIEEMRTSLDGATPSIVLKRIVMRDPAFNQLKAQYDALLEQVSHQTPTAIADDKGDKFYTIEQFMARLQIVMGRTYAWRTDYVRATQNSTSCRPAKNEHIQQWQRTRKVPAWAYEQIDSLQFEKRGGKGGPQWTDADYEFLIARYLEDERRSNADLAGLCSKHFGRDISEDSIKGAVDRSRKKGKIPKLRPKKEKS